MDTPLTPLNPISKVPLNFMKCPVCLSQYDVTRALRKPIMLECHHSACRICVSSLINRLPGRPSNGEDSLMINPRAMNCPVCRARTRIPINGINGLQENFYIVAILENMQHHISSPITTRNTSDDSLKMWCGDCCKVATTDCENHSLKKVSEAIDEMEEVLSQKIAHASTRLFEQEMIAEGSGSTTELDGKMDILRHCLSQITSLVNRKIISLQGVKDRKLSSEAILSGIRTLFLEIETKKNVLRELLDEPSSANLGIRPSVTRKFEIMLDNLQQLSEMMKQIDDITSNITLDHQPEEYHQHHLEQLSQLITELTEAFNATT